MSIARHVVIRFHSALLGLWRDRMMDSPEFRDATKRSWAEPSESALEILDKRYAKGG